MAKRRVYLLLYILLAYYSYQPKLKGMHSGKILRRFISSFFFIMIGAGFCFSQQHANYTTFLKNSTGISGLQFSPDGKSLLYTTSKVDWENNRRKTEYFLYDLASKSAQSFSLKERGANQPAWSPSGKYMSFIAISDTTGTALPQVYIQEWPNGKANCITASRSGVSGFKWSPNEEAILFVAKDTLQKKTGTERFVQAFEVGNNSYTTTARPLSSHLFISNIKTGISKKLTNGEWTVQDASWISDTVVLVTRTISPYSGDYTKSSAIAVNVNSAMMTDVGKAFTTLGDVAFSSAANMIAVRHTKNNIPANIPEISLIRWDNKKTVNLTAKLDRYISGYEWMPDGNSLILQIADGLKSRLITISLDGKTDHIPLTDITGVGQFTVNKDGRIALTGFTPTNAPEIFLYDPKTKSLEKLTSHNQFLESYVLGKTEGIEWPVGGGMTADGAVTYPPNFEKDKKYPLVLLIHGGPTSASGISLSPFAQHLAAQGWIVFQPNYRGSTNRGNTFQSAISNDAGFGPGEDIIKGVQILKQKGFIDEKKIAVTGWSYGGYMTAWLIGKYPTMWKAAVAGAAPVDITDMSSLTDLNAAIRHAITSSPWKGDNYKKYFEMSPISNLSKARTPTLVMSVVGDERVSITGSYKIYHALKANNVPVQFIAYPGTTHFPTDPVNNNDVYMRWTAWLKKYLD